MSSSLSPNKPGTPSQGLPGSSTSSSLAASTDSTAVESPSDGRRRQAYRDEAIRRKINTSLSKRGATGGAAAEQNATGAASSGSRSRQTTRRPPPGTVLSLRPSPPLTMKYTATVFEAARLMAAKRENCVLVVDDEDTVCGIFTAKDLAFRVVGVSLDSKSVTIEQIMTRNPMCARTDTSATEALNLMVSEGFRHLPIMDDNQDIAGVLDITKCFHEAMEKLERAYNSSRKLYDALEGVQMEGGLAGNSQKAAQIISYVEALKRQMEGPDLTTVLDESTMPVFVNSKTNAAEAAKLMKERNTTAVLVTDNNHITGIVTSKDIVLRVIAAGFNPSICSLVRVMTPQPDFAPQTMTIQSALRQMYDGNYLNLPVMGDNNEIVGIVDVLTLTYATLEQINSITTPDAEGPAWNKFWMSFDEHDNHSTHSDNSGYNTRSITSGTQRSSRRRAADEEEVDDAGEVGSPGITSSELAQFNIDGSAYEILPNDSVSHAGLRADLGLIDDGRGSSLGVNALGGALPATATASVAAASQFSGGDFSTTGSGFPFKFKTPAGRVHRITVLPSDGLGLLRSEILHKLKPDELAQVGGAEHAEDEDGHVLTPGFAVSYVDDEGDVIAITSDKDMAEAIDLYRAMGRPKAELYVHHPDEHVTPLAPAPAAGAAAPPAAPTAQAGALVPARRGRGPAKYGDAGPTSSDESDGEGRYARRGGGGRRGKKGARGGNANGGEPLIPGVPDELLLPGALVTLAASILLVFALSRQKY